MKILKSKYKKILKKLNLSRDQLKELHNELQPQNICAGPFIKDNKMCPNTIALSIKLNKKPENKVFIKKILNQSGVTSFELLIFYFLFDLPSIISGKLFNKLLGDLRGATQELIEDKFR